MIINNTLSFSIMAPKKQCHFQSNWKLNPDYHWLQEEEKNLFYAKCSICKKSFSLSNMGESAVKSHLNSAKHKSGVSARPITKYLPRTENIS